MDALTRHPQLPATRLDVQRHSLEDKRASYAWMNADLRGDRENRFLATLRALRTSVATMFMRAERPAHQQPVDEPADITAIV